MSPKKSIAYSQGRKKSWWPILKTLKKSQWPIDKTFKKVGGLYFVLPGIYSIIFERSLSQVPDGGLAQPICPTMIDDCFVFSWV